MCDIDGDGFEDLAFAVAFGAQQRLLRFDPKAKRFVDETKERLPDLVLNSNGVGYGDLDDDGDLDLVWVDSGPNSDRRPGGKARLLLNDGKGVFSEAADQFPAKPKIGAQNAKILDIDGDLDLDVVVDGKSPVTQLYLNDGKGHFTLDEQVIPKGGRGSAPYEIEWADLDQDGDLDAAHMSWGGGRRDGYLSVVLRNDLVETGKLGFTVVTDALRGRNREDENEFAFLDADDDGRLDLIAATLVSGPTQEKLYLNRGALGANCLHENRHAFSNFPDGTLDLAIIDVDGDGRHDVVTAQGESDRFGDFRNRLYRNGGAKDTRGPVLVRHGVRQDGERRILRVFVRDAIADDGHVVAKVRVEWEAEGALVKLPLVPIGGGGHRGELPTGVERYRLVATDRVGNVTTGAWIR